MTQTLIVVADNGPEPNWGALVREGSTLVIRVGVARVLNIVARLIAAGLSPDTRAAAVAAGVQCAQVEFITTLGDLPARLVAEAQDSPAILVIGEAATLTAVAHHVAATPRVADAAARNAA